MPLNRDVFFKSIRASLFMGRLSQDQVDGINDLLDVVEATPACADPRFAAYIFASAFHESGQRMTPCREGFASSNAAACAAVASLYAKGRISQNYALPVNGVSYYGRGRIQNTYKANYEKLEKRFGQPFVSKPDLLLDSKIDAQVSVVGHIEGIWTGKKLGDYFSTASNDPVGARRIVNGTDKNTLIAGYYADFVTAFRAAEMAGVAPVAPTPAPTPKPLPLPSIITPSPKPPQGFWARFKAAFTGKAA